MYKISKNQNGQDFYDGLWQDRTITLGFCHSKRAMVLPSAAVAVDTLESLIVQEWMESPPALRVDPRAEEGALANSKTQRTAFRRFGWLGVLLRVELQHC